MPAVWPWGVAVRPCGCDKRLSEWQTHNVSRKQPRWRRGFVSLYLSGRHQPATMPRHASCHHRRRRRHRPRRYASPPAVYPHHRLPCLRNCRETSIPCTLLRQELRSASRLPRRSPCASPVDPRHEKARSASSPDTRPSYAPPRLREAAARPAVAKAMRAPTANPASGDGVAT
jgi:hypothetical protein